MLKDILREYEGQEAHTVHLVFSPKTSSRLQNILQENNKQTSSNTNQSSSSSSTAAATTASMSTNELRQRHTTTATSSTTANVTPAQQQQSNVNIPSSNGNYYNAFYGTTMPLDANSILAQQYAMQTWMHQAYAQYMNSYMNM